MVEHLFPGFLRDEQAYRNAELYWIEVWQAIDSEIRKPWSQPWFQPLPPSIGEGNPIFSAVSLELRRGIRIIQFAPTEKGLEFVAYPDTFGGSISDPNSIRELVISCALSDVAVRVALSLMHPWAQGDEIDLGACEAGLVRSNSRLGESVFADRNLVPPRAYKTSGGGAEERIFPERFAA
jgi:hypothetical protein